jgi:phospholipase A2
MDSGISNNLPNHILARPERGTDVILAFDTSSDVQTGSALQRIQNWADDCNLELEEWTEQFHPSQPRYPRDADADADAAKTPAQAIESQFLGQYTRVFRGLRDSGDELFLIYCPLLPNGSNPGFDPAVGPCPTYV